MRDVENPEIRPLREPGDDYYEIWFTEEQLDDLRKDNSKELRDEVELKVFIDGKDGI
ncbi:MAG: hypothetical protein KAS32_06960 [Candidatus Peribacteraceae bacterium]|nr:hypothetical protein [Candidatus Peribacteraceae bacterium]